MDVNSGKQRLVRQSAHWGLEVGSFPGFGDKASPGSAMPCILFTWEEEVTCTQRDKRARRGSTGRGVCAVHELKRGRPSRLAEVCMHLLFVSPMGPNPPPLV